MIGIMMLAAAAAGGDVSSFESGNSLYEMCKSNAGLCRAYVEGVQDASNAIGFEVGNVTLCGPKEMTAEQAADVVTEYLRTHPATRHQAAGSLVYQALREAFPCPK